ncbi:MAG: hypothetical protein K9M57_07240 [Phycisphaerae bacterium]|nr:hypothetical protein [Phycisphaerae bacterium]
MDDREELFVLDKKHKIIIGLIVVWFPILLYANFCLYLWLGDVNQLFREDALMHLMTAYRENGREHLFIFLIPMIVTLVNVLIPIVILSSIKSFNRRKFLIGYSIYNLIALMIGFLLSEVIQQALAGTA